VPEARLKFHSRLAEGVSAFPSGRTAQTDALFTLPGAHPILLPLVGPYTDGRAFTDG